jgi:glycosyltransferase involved in cell wall biosynthesis
MKIAIYSHSIAPSIDGVSRRFTRILWEFYRQGHELILFTIEDAPEDIPPVTEIIVLSHMCFPCYPTKKAGLSDFKSLAQIVSGLARHRPDIVHITIDTLSSMFAFAGLLCSVPVVGSFHTDVLELLKVCKSTALQHSIVVCKEYNDQWILDSCGTTSTSYQQKLLYKQGIRTEHIVKTGVDLDVFTENMANEDLRFQMTFGNPEAFLCVYVGRLTFEKRIEVIVEACKNLPNVYLALVGDGTSAEEFAALHGAENRVFCKPQFLTQR